MACAVVMAATVATSCSEPATAPRETPSGTEVPTVGKPLSPAALSIAPCEAFDLREATVVLGPGTALQTQDNTGPTAPRCAYTNRDTNANIAVALANYGLARYHHEFKGNALLWREFQIRDFPAVATVSPLGGRRERDCTIALAVTDSVLLFADIRLATTRIGHDDPCTVATAVATTGLENMRRRSG
ncbi:hypothetical protein HUW46_09355 [Amycolatopsis sp. CA-230715]|nr:hypothetical protein HUW46_09355 [Amycolatopsis sp. CA-230715]